MVAPGPLLGKFNPLKARLSPILHRFAHAAGLSRRLAHRINAPRVLMFHGIGDGPYPLQAFRRQMIYLRTHFTLISLDTLLRGLFQGQPLPRDPLVLTFDDGLRNNATMAFPVLQEQEIPATFFVCPGLIESRQWLWNQEARLRLNSLDQKQFTRLGQQLQPVPPTIETLIDWMKTLPLDQRRQVETLIREATPQFNPTREDRLSHELMTWQDLEALDPELITIGGHSFSHPILTQLDSEALDHEIAECRGTLEAKLNRRVRHFCYPNGAHNPIVIEAVRRHFDSALTTDIGFIPSRPDPYRLPRIPADPSLAYLSWRLHRPTA